MKASQIKHLQEKISQLVKRAVKSGAGDLEKEVLGKISKSEADLIKQKTGINVSGYYRVIDSYSIIHTLNTHGDKEKEALRGQLPISAKDFENIPLIVNTKNIVYKGKNKKGLDVILYSAELNNRYYYAEEIRTRRKELVLNSMWKRKK
jgi:hypothetical protein